MGKSIVEQAKQDVKNKQKETDMKNRNYKQIIETLKTIIITALVAGIVGFYFGIQYKSNDASVLQSQVKDVVSSITAEASKQ